jgi:hypothetical protein
VSSFVEKAERTIWIASRIGNAVINGILTIPGVLPLGGVAFLIGIILISRWVLRTRGRLHGKQLVARNTILVLLAWKALSTDWIVTTRNWRYDADPPPWDYFDRSVYRPPQRPIFIPPRPWKLKPGAREWRDYFGAGGAFGPVGNQLLWVDFVRVQLKIWLGFLVLYPLCIVLRRHVRGARISPPQESTGDPISANAGRLATEQFRTLREASLHLPPRRPPPARAPTHRR